MNLSLLSRLLATFCLCLMPVFQCSTEKCDKKNPTVGDCQNIGSLRGILGTLNSIHVAVSDIISSANYRTQKLEEDICMQPTLGNQINQSLEDHCLKAEPDCKALKAFGFSKSGIYRIWPTFLKHSIQVVCDMETDGGGWTLIQRRGDFGKGHISFYETWEKYKKGFGSLDEEFWLGNDFIFALSQQAKMVLRIDLEDFDGEKRFAKYVDFRVSSELEKYKLSFGNYDGNAGNSLNIHNGKEFSTKDNGNACPKDFKGGWWYAACHEANLNGIYYQGNHSSFADGIDWLHFRGYHHSMKISEMKIRPCDC